MTPDEFAAALEAFEKAAMTIATIRAPVGRGRPSENDVRLYAARTATQFYFATVCKRTARAALPSSVPNAPARVRARNCRQQDGEQLD